MPAYYAYIALPGGSYSVPGYCNTQSQKCQFVMKCFFDFVACIRALDLFLEPFYVPMNIKKEQFSFENCSFLQISFSLAILIIALVLVVLLVIALVLVVPLVIALILVVIHEIHLLIRFARIV